MLRFSMKLVMWRLMVALLAAGISLAIQMSERTDGANPQPGTIIMADSRLCVDCHTFEFMERAVQDLYKAADNLDSQTETLLMRTEDRGLCRCHA